MVRSRAKVEQPALPLDSKAAIIILGLGVVFIPMTVSGGWDPWREPKELVFRTVAILLLVAGAFVITRRSTQWRDRLRSAKSEAFLCGAIIGWTLLTTATSQNRLLSIESLVTVVAAVVVFLAARLLAADVGFIALDACMVAPLVNAVFVMLQEYRIWNPFEFPKAALPHLRSTALVGNPNDVGTFLVAPALAAVVAALSGSGVRRWAYTLVACVVSAGLIASGTKTAMIALAAGLVTVALLRPLRQAAVAAGALIVVSVIVLLPHTRTGANFRRIATALHHGDYTTFSSERVVPFLAAFEMAKAHPLTGVGPGGFKYQFMPERIALRGKYPESLTRGYPQNFGATHDDHLQVAAETGLPGYLMFLAAIALVAFGAGRRKNESGMSGHQRFAHALRVPLAVTFFVVALAQFPLQIAAPRVSFLAFAALATGWDSRDE